MNLRKIRITNQKVKVVDNSWCYEYNKNLFEKLNFKNTQYNKKFKNGTIATVFKTTTYNVFDACIVKLVDKSGNECLIDSAGIEKI